MTRGLDEPLQVRTKVVFALGDHTVNLALSALSLLYPFFLTDYAGLAAGWTAGVLWLPRIVDAVTDPMMGRISDRTPWRWGRRRPWFLIGAIPFGVAFALLWLSPATTQPGKFAWHVSVYIAVSIGMTVLSVPYLALLPEMARDYDERTSLNTFRSAAAVLGTFAAVGMNQLADLLGGGAAGFARAGAIASVWLVLPWLAVYRSSFERPGADTAPTTGILEGARTLLQHRSYRLLVGCYVAARAAVDLVGAMFLYYFTYWLGRRDDFGPTLFLFLILVVASLPIWLSIARHLDKRTIFVIGAAWWIVAQVPMFLAQPEWPRWVIFAIAGFAAIGYAVADLMPWAMLGETIDEDQLRTGERREGVYAGAFTFVRKVAGASAVALALLLLQSAGYSKGQEQPASALWMIRILTAAAPALLLCVAILFALRYPISRGRHAEILGELLARERSSAAAG